MNNRYIWKNGSYPEDVVVVTERTETTVKFYSESGGFEKTGPAEKFEEDFRAVDPAVDVLRWRRAYLCFEDGPLIPGFSDGRRWNGWAMPAFTKETLDAVLPSLGADDFAITYDPTLDAYRYPDDDNEPETSTTIEVDGHSVKVYMLGAGSWCWDEVAYRFNARLLSEDGMTVTADQVVKHLVQMRDRELLFFFKDQQPCVIELQTDSEDSNESVAHFQLFCGGEPVGDPFTTLSVDVVAEVDRQIAVMASEARTPAP